MVLPALPAYSETFFRSKIHGLIDHGYEVILFIGGGSRHTDLDCKVVFQNKVAGSRVLLPIRIALVLFKAFLFFPATTRRFLSFEKQEGLGLKKRIENLFINYHILSQKKLDFLHFGYTTVTIRRENVAKAVGARCSLSMRGYDINVYPLMNPGCYNQLWKHLDKVHTISDDLKKKAISLGMPSDTNVQKITPAIDAESIPVRIKMGLEGHGNIKILTVARLHWIKGLEYAFRAIQLLKSQEIKVQYDIIGTGSEAERLAFTVHQYGLESEVNFLGKRPHLEIQKSLQQYDIYLQPSLEEGFCNAVLEAQAAGLYCIVSETGGLVENVSNGESGWTVPPRDSKALADKIIEVIRLPQEQLSRVSKTARKRVLEKFNLEKQQKEFVDFYRNDGHKRHEILEFNT